MKKLRSLGFLLLAIITLPLAAQTINPRPFTIPAIHEWKGGQGQLLLTPQSRILYADARLRTAAESLARDWQITGLNLTVAEGKKAAAGDILFVYKPQKKLGAEGYTIDIDKTIRIEATEPGAMHAAQTLLQIAQLLPSTQGGGGSGSFPKGKITDRPDYPLRGLVLDCGRKYIPIDYMRRLVRTMAYYKMNTLEVHLNDKGHPPFFYNDWDQVYSAFRLESELFPGLTAEDGSYTKDEFRQFILDAAAQGVEIIPEIDAPAHSLCFSHYRPSLGSKEFGMDHLELTNPEVIPFIDSVFAEYLGGPNPVFACPRVHVGTDEYSNKKQEIVELFRAFTDHMIRTVESYGKQAVVWGALTHAKGETPVKADDVMMFTWYNPYAQPDSMYKLGYEIVNVPDRSTYIVPAANYYFDYLNIPRLYKEFTPANIAGVRLPERAPRLKGGMFAVWNDLIGNGIAVADIHHRIMPALQVIAEKTWAVDTVRTCSEWQRLATSLGEAPGINDLGRYPKGVVLTEAVVNPSSARAVPFIGWPYRVSFDVEAAEEVRGTALFRDNEAEFYLADPVTGRLGFIRDGYLFSFKHVLRPGAHEHIAIEGTNVDTKLYVNGKLVETLSPQLRTFPKDQKYKVVRTLRFPLQRTDTFLRSRVTNLKVESL